MSDRSFFIALLTVMGLSMQGFAVIAAIMQMHRLIVVALGVPGLTLGAVAYLTWAFGRRADARVMRVKGNGRS